MKKVFLIKIFILLLLTANSAVADNPGYGQVIQTHLIKSKYVDQIFEIHVWVPQEYRNSSKKLHNLYIIIHKRNTLFLNR
jgi:hypothetical protein